MSCWLQGLLLLIYYYEQAIITLINVSTITLSLLISVNCLYRKLTPWRFKLMVHCSQYTKNNIQCTDTLVQLYWLLNNCWIALWNNEFSYNTKILTEFNKLYDVVLYCATLTHASSYLTLFVDLRLVTLHLLIIQYIQITPCEDWDVFTALCSPNL